MDGNIDNSENLSAYIESVEKFPIAVEIIYESMIHA
jgi:hypothetical protein